MTKSKLPQSIRKHLRRRKAEIRREFGGGEEAQKRIAEETRRFKNIKNDNAHAV